MNDEQSPEDSTEDQAPEPARTWIRWKLIEEHQHIVAWVLKRKFKAAHFMASDREEMLSHGYVGLCRAARAFDPTRGFKFSTYAVSVIRMEMIQYLQSKGAGRNRRALFVEMSNVYRDRTTPSALPDYKDMDTTERREELEDLRNQWREVSTTARLTPEELEYMRLRFDGLDRQERCRALGIDNRIDKVRQTRIFQKLRKAMRVTHVRQNQSS